jgi:CDGSH-type Zn-finger protein
MDKPITAADHPIVIQLEKHKKYAWCSCGRSKRQPFCDGRHRGTGLEPTFFTVEETGEVALCQCKGTRNPPYCDGSHTNSKQGQ